MDKAGNDSGLVQQKKFLQFSHNKIPLTNADYWNPHEDKGKHI